MKGKDELYFGDSSRTAFECGKEHCYDYETLAKDSHMLKHHVIEHEENQEKSPEGEQNGFLLASP